MKNENLFNEIMPEFIERILGADKKTIEILSRTLSPIKGLCKEIEESGDFELISVLEPTFEAVSDSAHNGTTLKLFGLVHNETYNLLSDWIEKYEFINREYQLRIKDCKDTNNLKKNQRSRLNLINHVPKLINRLVRYSL